jgi:hypothetical protein
MKHEQQDDQQKFIEHCGKILERGNAIQSEAEQMRKRWSQTNVVSDPSAEPSQFVVQQAIPLAQLTDLLSRYPIVSTTFLKLATESFQAIKVRETVTLGRLFCHYQVFYDLLRRIRAALSSSLKELATGGEQNLELQGMEKRMDGKFTDLNNAWSKLQIRWMKEIDMKECDTTIEYWGLLNPLGTKPEEEVIWSISSQPFRDPFPSSKDLSSILVNTQLCNLMPRTLDRKCNVPAHHKYFLCPPPRVQGVAILCVR